MDRRAARQYLVLALDPEKVRTNVVVFDISGTGLEFAQLSALLKSKGLLISTAGGTRARIVTHLNVSRKDCEVAVQVMEEVLLQHASRKLFDSWRNLRYSNYLQHFLCTGLPGLLHKLDTQRGIYLSSGYEYPERYSRWDFAARRAAARNCRRRTRDHFKSAK